MSGCGPARLGYLCPTDLGVQYLVVDIAFSTKLGILSMNNLIIKL